MADPPAYDDTGDSTDVGRDPGSITGTPRWVKVFGMITLVVVMLLVVLLLTGGHGPSRHASPAGITHGEQQP